MNNAPWSKILLFSVLSLVLGVILGLLLRPHGHGRGFCRGAGHHNMAGCDNGDKSRCGDGHGHAHWKKHAHDEDHSDARVHAIIEELKAGEFQGDTTIAIEGGTVNINREGEQLEVRVEMKDTKSEQEGERDAAK